MHRLTTSLFVALARLIGRERAVLAGVAVALLQAAATGELTKATTLPVLAGIALRFFVTPYHRGDTLDVPGAGGVAG